MPESVPAVLIRIPFDCFPTVERVMSLVSLLQFPTFVFYYTYYYKRDIANTVLISRRSTKESNFSVLGKMFGSRARKARENPIARVLPALFALVS